MLVTVIGLTATAGNLKDKGTGWKLKKIMITARNLIVMAENFDVGNGWKFKHENRGDNGNDSILEDKRRVAM